MNRIKNRRGRPRQERPTIDKGTDELQQKRHLLLKEGQDSALAESLLGILYGRQLISQSLYEAGRFFGELGYRYEPCLGHKFRENSSILNYEKVDGRGYTPVLCSDEQDAKRTQAWRKALKALEQAGPEPYKIVLKVVFFDQDLYTTVVPRFKASSVRPLRKGLEFLETYFKEGLRGARGKRRGRGLDSGQSTSFQLFSKEFQPCSPP